jgi:hypothetical protein
MKTVTVVLAAASIAMLAAGCGSSNEKPESSETSKSQSGQSFASAAYKYAACIRGHGVPNFPNPQVHNGPSSHGISQAVPAGVGTSPKFAAAQKACKGLMPGPEGESATQHSAQQHSRANAMLAFAQCLRGHGLPSFPDPTAQGQISPTMIRAAGIDLRAPSFLAAAKACVGATHGLITLADVQEAIQRLGDTHARAGTGAAAGAGASAGG